MTHTDPAHPTTVHPAAGRPYPHPVPGRGLGIAGFILSLLGAFAPLGLVLSTVSFVQATRANRSNGLALAGVVIGAVGTILLVVVIVASVTTLSSQTELCGIGDLITLSCR